MSGSAASWSGGFAPSCAWKAARRSSQKAGSRWQVARYRLAAERRAFTAWHDLVPRISKVLPHCYPGPYPGTSPHHVNNDVEPYFVTELGKFPLRRC